MSWMADNAEALRLQAQERRNRGLSTGKSAKGWNVKRSNPCDELELLRARLKTVFREHCSQVLADYQWATNGSQEIPF